MAIIPQMRLFSWKEIDELGDLDRLCLVLEYMPDEESMQTLEKASYSNMTVLKNGPSRALP